MLPRRPTGGRDIACARLRKRCHFEITKEGRTALVNCKRWKVVHTGVDALFDLHALKESSNAQECIYVAAGEITANARAFASRHAIRLVGGPELAQLFRGADLR